MTMEMLRFVAPLVLVPVLLWIGYRYLPLLADAGRPRLYLLLLLCGFAVAVQAGMVVTQAYPLVVWDMYGSAGVQPETWRFVAVGTDGERDFPWEEVAPIRSKRAFQTNFMDLASELEAAESEEERLEAETVLDRTLSRLIEIHNGRRGRVPLAAVRVERCRVDIRDPRPRHEVACETFRVVGGADGDAAPPDGAAPDAEAPGAS